MSRMKYFAAEESELAVSHIQRKGHEWFQYLNETKYLELIKRSWLAYYGKYYEDSHSINLGGEVGELVNIAVNHYRNIAEHILRMTTASRPVFQARSTNTDYKSQVQTILANGLLDYYMRDKRLEKHLKKAVESAVVMGAGFIRMDWDSTSGEIYDSIDPEPVFPEDTVLLQDEEGNNIQDEEGNFYAEDGSVVQPFMDEEGNLTDADGRVLESFPIYEGDVRFTNLSPYDVLFDTTKEDYDQNDWLVVRTFKNRHDLAAKFPEYYDEIMQLETKDRLLRTRTTLSSIDDTDDVPVYEFFHKRTESLPDGRYLMYLSDRVILMDTPIPYRTLPVYRISSADILGTPYGYTNMFDLLPLQEAVNSLYSTVVTNNNAFGVQSILNPRGNNVTATQVGTGMNFIEYDPAVGGQSGKPEALQLTKTSPETYKLMEMLENAMETIAGINSVVRGNVEATNLTSGNALALIQSQAIQFISGLQQSYIMLIEDIGTGLIKLLQDFASVPRVAEISGRSNKNKMQEFTGESIDSVSRVVVDVGNALASTTAGRTQMADNLIQMGVINTPEQYFSVINTGKLETMTEGQLDHNLLIRRENELLIDDSAPVIAMAIDKHSQHIREHMNVLADPEIRLDPALAKRVQDHIMEHINLARTTDPSLLAMIGEQPLGPVNGSPVAPGNAAPPQPNQQGMESNEQLLSNPEASGTPVDGGGAVAPAQPATVEGAANTPQEAFNNNIL